ncbi:MAG: hypothetical protein ACJAXU_001925, partial [Paracoccaceae bacterium]
PYKDKKDKKVTKLNKHQEGRWQGKRK